MILEFKYCIIGQCWIYLTNEHQAPNNYEILIEDVELFNWGRGMKPPIKIKGNRVNYDFLCQTTTNIDGYELTRLKHQWLTKRPYLPIGWHRLKERTAFKTSIHNIIRVDEINDTIRIKYSDSF
jgi:hypothetical protein